MTYVESAKISQAEISRLCHVEHETGAVYIALLQRNALALSLHTHAIEQSWIPCSLLQSI